VNADAFTWLLDKEFDDSAAIVTSLPDESELVSLLKREVKGAGHSDSYETFLRKATSSILKTIAPTSYALFMQTDRKKDGHCIDKAYIVTDEARKKGFKTIFHKIILTREPGKVNMFRPSFTHLLCFSQKGSAGKATPDVIYSGKALYKNGMGVDAVRFALDFLNSKGISKVVDPFCGQGTVLFIAKTFYSHWKEAIGVDIDATQCEKFQAFLKTQMGSA
jgi:hypothetical protein